MRSERRHDLQRNDLLDWLTQGFDQVKPYANVILVGLVVVVVGMLGWRIWSGSASKKTAEAWEAMFAALDRQQTDRLDGRNGVTERFSGTPVAAWAALAAADLHLRSGCDELFSNMATASDALQKAEDDYLSALDASSESAVQQRATFGLARTYETMAATRQSSGVLDKAIEKYRQVVHDWPEGTFAVRAARRIEDLEKSVTIDGVEKKITRDFYDKLAQYDPQPAAIAPAGGGTGDLPFDLDSLSPGGAASDSSTPLGVPGSSGADDSATDDTSEDSAHADAEAAPPAEVGKTTPPADSSPITPAENPPSTGTEEAPPAAPAAEEIPPSTPAAEETPPSTPAAEETPPAASP